MESGFGGFSENKESKNREEQRKKAAEAEEKRKAIAEQKKIKAQIEMERLKKMNMGAAEYMKQQKKMEAKGKLNKNIQGFQINIDAGNVDTAVLKGKQ